LILGAEHDCAGGAKDEGGRRSRMLANEASRTWKNAQSTVAISSVTSSLSPVKLPRQTHSDDEPSGWHISSQKNERKKWGQKMRSTVGAKKWGQQMRPKVDVKSCGHLPDLG